MEDRIYDMFEKFMGKLDQMNQSLREMLANHEKRITVLEVKKDDGFKTKMLEWLAKALIVAVTATCALAGGGSILAKVFGQ